MQSKAIQSWETSNSQALPAFSLGVAFVDESVLSLSPGHEIDTVIKDIKLIKQLHVAPLEDVISSGSDDKAARLKELVGVINDETGRDDFIRCLRMLSLQKVLTFSACLCFHMFLSLYRSNLPFHV
jgi:cytoplasmic tRNA 2-thiolation protein 2